MNEKKTDKEIRLEMNPDKQTVTKTTKFYEKRLLNRVRTQ